MYPIKHTGCHLHRCMALYFANRTVAAMQHSRNSFYYSVVPTYFGANEALIFGGIGVPFGPTTSHELHRLRIPRDGQVQIVQQRELSKYPPAEPDAHGRRVVPPIPPVYGQAMAIRRTNNSDDKTTKVR